MKTLILSLLFIISRSRVLKWCVGIAIAIPPIIIAPLCVNASEIASRSSVIVYTLAEGDTVEEVATYFAVAPDAIEQEGDTLYIPLSFESTESGIVPAITQKPDLLLKSSNMHTCSSNQTLWDIAVIYGVPLDGLVKANGFTLRHTLSLGESVIIPRVLGDKANDFTQLDYAYAYGRTAKIIDNATGKQFFAKRTHGIGCAAAEPVTPYDAEIAESLGGEIRSITVEIDGQQFAAATNFAAEGLGFIGGNNFDGHFKITEGAH